MDLWDYGLTPQEFMAAHYLEKVAGRASGREIADRLDVSRRTGERILSSLADKGLIQRVRHARYVLLWVTQSASSMTQSASPVTQTKVLSTTSSNSVLVDMSNDISTRAARPFEGTHIEKRFPMADDLEPGRLKPPAPKPPSGPCSRSPTSTTGSHSPARSGASRTWSRSSASTTSTPSRRASTSSRASSCRQHCRWPSGTTA